MSYHHQRVAPRYLLCGTLAVCFALFSACQPSPQGDREEVFPALLTEAELLAQPQLLAGIYTAYPDPVQQLTPAPEGYEPFYISHYGRHGSRFQPSDARYVDTRQRLRDAHDAGNLTPFGESLLPRIERLCDYACGHGGMLTTVGARQHREIAKRMYERFPQVFARHQHISARSSIVPRCIESMHAFVGQLTACDSTMQILAESDSCYMSYLSYETPEQRLLSKDKDTWHRDYGRYALSHLQLGRLMDTLFVNPVGLDSLKTYADLYWLAAGMQNLDLDVSLSDVFTPDEMLRAYRCVNYRMYITCGNCPVGNGIPAASASSLLRNIIQSADEALTTDTISATLRFGHDSNLLRLLTLMQVHNASNSEADEERYWTAWQECTLSPMAANLQFIFYRPTAASHASPASASSSPDILVKLLLNENETRLDASISPVNGPYYSWQELRSFLTSRLTESAASDSTFTVNIQ